MNTAVSPLFYADRTARGRLRLTGRDRQTFLQGMVTNDIVGLAPGGGCYAFALDASGHALSDLRVLCTENYLLLDTEPDQATFVAATLDRYLIMEKCRITDVTGELTQITVGGTDAPIAIKAAFGIELAGDAAEGVNTPFSLPDGAVGLAAVVRLTVFPTFDLYVPNPDAAAILDALAAGGAAPLTSLELDALRIEAGVPRFGADFDARVLAPETGQQARAISYRKGCYIGQEIVARIHARGHTNRTFTGFNLHGQALPEPDSRIKADGREVGRVTSSAMSPSLGRAVALGYLRNEFAEPGTPVTIAGQTAEVAALPFVAQ
jgi:folate-binding protein YgfZ